MLYERKLLGYSKLAADAKVVFRNLTGAMKKIRVSAAVSRPSFFLDLFLELVAGMKRHDPPGFDWNSLTGAGGTSGARRLGSDLEIAKPGNLHVTAVHQAVGHQIEEGIDHVLRFALVQTDLLE